MVPAAAQWTVDWTGLGCDCAPGGGIGEHLACLSAICGAISGGRMGSSGSTARPGGGGLVPKCGALPARGYKPARSKNGKYL